MKEKISISILLIKEFIKGTDIEKWVAQGLERDITGQGDTPTEALKSFEHVIIGHIILDMENGKKPLTNVPRAPQFYWSLRENSKGLVNSKPEPISFPEQPNIDVSRKILAFA